MTVYQKRASQLNGANCNRLGFLWSNCLVPNFEIIVVMTFRPTDPGICAQLVQDNHKAIRAPGISQETTGLCRGEECRVRLPRADLILFLDAGDE